MADLSKQQHSIAARLLETVQLKRRLKANPCRHPRSDTTPFNSLPPDIVAIIIEKLGENLADVTPVLCVSKAFFWHGVRLVWAHAPKHAIYNVSSERRHIYFKWITAIDIEDQPGHVCRQRGCHEEKTCGEVEWAWFRGDAAATWPRLTELEIRQRDPRNKREVSGHSRKAMLRHLQKVSLIDVKIDASFLSNLAQACPNIREFCMRRVGRNESATQLIACLNSWTSLESLQLEGSVTKLFAPEVLNAVVDVTTLKRLSLRLSESSSDIVEYRTFVQRLHQAVKASKAPFVNIVDIDIPTSMDHWPLISRYLLKVHTLNVTVLQLSSCFFESLSLFLHLVALKIDISFCSHLPARAMRLLPSLPSLQILSIVREPNHFNSPPPLVAPTTAVLPYHDPLQLTHQTVAEICSLLPSLRALELNLPNRLHFLALELAFSRGVDTHIRGCQIDQRRLEAMGLKDINRAGRPVYVPSSSSDKRPWRESDFQGYKAWYNQWRQLLGYHPSVRSGLTIKERCRLEWKKLLRKTTGSCDCRVARLESLSVCAHGLPHRR